MTTHVYSPRARALRTSRPHSPAQTRHDRRQVLIQQFGTPTLAENWRNMEQLVKDGLTKSIGVSNYASEDIEELSKTWRIKPAVNQVYLPTCSL